jgi:hypothetical protein
MRMRTLAMGAAALLAFLLPRVAHAQINFDEPTLGAPKEDDVGGDVDFGFGSLSIGGLLDMRYMSLDGNMPALAIHVDELVITTNIGDNISILAEQLLPTSRLVGLESEIGDDHGFAYALFSNLPLLPPGTAFKVGRFRFRWGIDGVLDAPSNPIYNLVRKNLGFVSDRGIELSGFFGPFDYTLGLASGPDFVLTSTFDGLGNAVGNTKTSVLNNSAPLIVRLSTNNDFSSSFRIGASYFDGRSWGYQNFMPIGPGTPQRFSLPGGLSNRSMLVYRQHGAVDASIRHGRFESHLEYSVGRDQVPGLGTLDTGGQLVRINYIGIPRKLDFTFQYDRYDDGRSGSKPEQAASAGVRVFVHDQAYLRFGVLLKDIDSPSGPRAIERQNVGFLQYYLPF